MLFHFHLMRRIMLPCAGAAIWGAVLGYLGGVCWSGMVRWVAGVAIVGPAFVDESPSKPQGW